MWTQPSTWLTLNFTFHDKTLRMPSRFVWTIIIDDTAACVGKLGWRMTQFFRDGSQFCLTTGRIKPKHVGADRLTLISFVRSRFKRVCRVRMNGWVVATCIENRTDYQIQGWKILTRSLPHTTKENVALARLLRRKCARGFEIHLCL